MDSTFDIFKRLPDGTSVWLKAVCSRREAEEQMALEAANSPGEYFIFLQGQGVVAKHVADSEEGADAV